MMQDRAIDVIRELPAKQCATDLLKDNVDVLAPFITELFNRSLSSGVFPTQFKAAYITPLLNKCVSRTDTNPPFAFQTAFPRGTDFSVSTGRGFIRCL